jgi:tetratricopeptide (TPR) repeat protein
MGGRPAYTFADVVQLKAAKELVDRGVPMQRVRKSLEALRERLPEADRKGARLRVASDGESLVVCDGEHAFETDSGQVVFSFALAELDRRMAEIVSLREPERETAHRDPSRTAHAWFLEGRRCEEHSDLQGAQAAYEKALALDPGLAAAHTNLGNLWFGAGRLEDAGACYERALASDPDQPEATFNSAHLHERQGRPDLAMAFYRRALRVAPDYADAHFNLAMLLDRSAQSDFARHHFQCFLRLCDGENSPYTRLAQERVACFLTRADDWIETD